MSTLSPVSETVYGEIFDSPSQLPSSDRGSFKIDDLKMNLIYDIKKKVAYVSKAYRLIKAKEANPGNLTDQFWEVTGCPEGTITYARDKDTSVAGPGIGYGTETYHDEKQNLIHRIDLMKKHAVGDVVILFVKMELLNLEKESKIIEMEKSILFKSLLLRFDFAYSIPIKYFKFTVEVTNGLIRASWPKTLSVIDESSKSVVFEKTDGLRPQEVFNPLVQMNSGSRFGSRAITYAQDALITLIVEVSIYLIVTGF